MRPNTTDETLRVEFDAHHFELPDATRDRMLDDLDTLTSAVAHFPGPSLNVMVSRRDRNNEFVVKTSLHLTDRVLVASEHAADIHPAFEKCVRVLVDQLKDYKDRLGQVPERQKVEQGTRNELLPTLPPDETAVRAAVDAGDYTSFRAALQGYEEPLRDRAGRWLERSDEADGRVGTAFTVADVVEDVFLDAFENFGHWQPVSQRFGEWLDGRIDPAVRALLRHPDRELESVSMARTLQDVAATREEK